MAQYAVLIYAQDSAHSPDATPQDTGSCDRHSDELAESGSMLMAYALTPRDMATSIRGDTITDGPFVDSKEVVAGCHALRPLPTVTTRLSRHPGTSPARRDVTACRLEPNARSLSEAPRAMLFMITGRNGSYRAGTARDHALRPLCLKLK